MRPQTTQARSIARPLMEDLTAQPFSGRVLGVFNRACNLIDDAGRVIALVLPEVGNGPFAISIEGSPGMFDALAPNQSAQATRQAVMIEPWQILLSNTDIWEPRIDCRESTLNIDLIAELIKPYSDWPNLKENTPLARRMAQLARTAANELCQTISQGDNADSLVAAVTRLAGLGSGLTPAGDDYLLGTMAALWLTGDKDTLSLVAKTAIPKTNALSAAFLKSAAKGEFMEPWHRLTAAWVAEDRGALVEAVRWIADFGASSGEDALAGFSKTLLNLAKKSMPSGK